LKLSFSRCLIGVPYDNLKQGSPVFNFGGLMDRRMFCRAAAPRLGLFFASVAPWLLMAIASASGYAPVLGEVGAMGLFVVTIILLPLAFALFIFSFVGISMRRTRDAGMPGPLGLLSPLLFASNFPFLVHAGAPGGPFSKGVLFQSLPMASLLALYCIAILCAMPPRYNRGANPFGVAGWVAFALGIPIAANAMLDLVVAFTGIHPWMHEHAWLLRRIALVTPYAMIAFAAILAWIAWRFRASPDPTSPPPLPAGVKYPPVPIAGLLLAALVCTFVVYAIVMGEDFPIATLPGVMAMNLFPITLPTLALYFFPLLGIWLIVTRRSAGSVALFVLALMPFLHWWSARSDSVRDHQREAAEVAAIATKPLPPQLPATIVFESQQTDGLRGVWEVPAIERTILNSGYNAKLKQFERHQRGSVDSQSFAATLPDEYLLLRVGRSSGFANKAENYSVAGGPFELRFVDASHDDLIAVWYRVFNPAPSAFPVLTLQGWYRGPNSGSAGDVDARVGEFLTSALKTQG
jgi:hypothetical protein